MPLLCLQYALVETVGEPYPAFMMPGFKGDGGYRDGAVQFSRVDVVFVGRDGEKVVNQRELLSEYDDSLHSTIMNNFLSPLREDTGPGASEEIKTWRQRLRQRLFPNLHAGARKRTDPRNVASLRQWLTRRSSRIFPQQVSERVEFRWFDEKIRIENGERKESCKPAGIFVVPLRVAFSR